MRGYINRQPAPLRVSTKVWTYITTQHGNTVQVEGVVHDTNRGPYKGLSVEVQRVDVPGCPVIRGTVTNAWRRPGDSLPYAIEVAANGAHVTLWHADVVGPQGKGVADVNDLKEVMST